MAHINYYLDLCADVYIVNGDAVLLRLHDKYNYWGAPGGHIDPGEDANETALKEAWEEVGLKIELVEPAGWTKNDTEDIKDLVPPHFVNRHFVTDTHEHSSFIFFGKSESRDINPQTEEDQGAECLWLTKSELDKLYKNDKRLGAEVYRYAKTALLIVK